MDRDILKPVYWSLRLRHADGDDCLSRLSLVVELQKESSGSAFHCDVPVVSGAGQSSSSSDCSTLQVPAASSFPES